MSFPLLSLVLATALSLSPCDAPGDVPCLRSAVSDAADQDTVFAVSPGQRLSLRNLSGTVRVTAWARDEVRILTGGDEGAGVRLRRTDDVIQVRPDQRDDDRGRYVVSVPSWMDLTIEGNELDVSVEGMRAAVSVRTGEGDVEVIDSEGPVSARSVEGVVVVEGVIGSVSAASGDDDVFVRDIQGPVAAQTVDGDVTLDDITSSDVEGSTVDGDVRFSGPLDPAGRYRLVTHDGDLVVVLDAEVSATVAVSTFDGDFESDFPVTMERFSAGQELRFTLGSGGARLFLEAFDGSIQLRRR